MKLKLLLHLLRPFLKLQLQHQQEYFFLLQYQYELNKMLKPYYIMATNIKLKGKKFLVTAGPTYEAIDPVRFIGNHSSGKMGIALAEELTKRGGDVTLVIGPSSEKISSTIKVEKVTSAAEMYEACMVIFEKVDIAIMSAAVADGFGRAVMLPPSQLLRNAPFRVTSPQVFNCPLSEVLNM